MKHSARAKLLSFPPALGNGEVLLFIIYTNGETEASSTFFFNGFHLGNEAKKRRRRKKNGILAHKIDERIVLFSTNAEV